MQTNIKQYAIGLGLALCAAGLANANTFVTFQVDMSSYGIDPNTETVSAHGSFNGWDAFNLTNNPSGANPYLYSGTTAVATNGSVMEYKYVSSSYSWEQIPKGGNRLVTLPSTSGASLVLPAVHFGDYAPAPVAVDVTFRVDMAQQISVGTFIPGVSSVYARGTWNSWDMSAAMTSDPMILRTNQYGLVTSNVFVCTCSVMRSPGETLDFKYYIDTGNNYESPAPGTGDPADHNNRFFNLSDGPPQTLPIVFFNDAPLAPVATNDVTFQVDMSLQILNGSFDPTFGTVEVCGDFNGWGASQILCTNNPAGPNPSIYSAVARIVNGIGTSEAYKFWSSVPVNFGWEALADNRSLIVTSGASRVLPVVYFSGLDPNDFLPADTAVTFTVSMTNAVGTDAHAFDPVNDSVFINADFLNWNNGFWDFTLPQLVNDPAGSKLYKITLTVPKGSPVALNYKYGINGNDDEAGWGQNHVRYVRTPGTYTLALDTFGDPHVEPSFGALKVGPASGGRVPVSWLGRPGVHLQTRANVASGAWQDLPQTDGAAWGNGYPSADGFTSVTNYPTSAGRTFFRLVKP